jgi:23S rRNA (cytosine1962-C5)-methyltransferase
MPQQAVVVVTRRGEERILRGHPWVFRSDVARAEGAEPGSIVEVRNRRGQPLGFAFHSTTSEIQIRMISREARGKALPATFLMDRLRAALRYRESVAPGVTTLRLVHAEGDGLPSIIVDRYGDVLVVQTLSQAAERLKSELVAALVELLQPRGILERNDPRVRLLEGLEQRVGLLHGEVPERLLVEINGISLDVDPWKGQKTGLFLDQRENYLAARGYARGRVLDAFAYQGGFGLTAASAASEVLALDVSEDAMARLRENAARNGLTQVRAEVGNAFDALRELDQQGQKFDLVVLDPPAFAKSRDAVERAVRGYKEINLRALRLLVPGGTLVTCSCSHHVGEELFEEVLAAAAADVGVPVAIVEKRRQSRDHPILLGVPETAYLKCMVLRRLT